MKEYELNDAVEADIIFASISMAEEGLDIPQLNTLIFGCAKKSIEQCVGRILRKSSIDELPTIINSVIDAVCSRGKSKIGDKTFIDSLKERVKNQKIEEVIVATSATVEGQTTAFYIEETLKNTKVKISKLAQGLPVGGEIESLDDGTLFSAFKNRTQI